MDFPPAELFILKGCVDLKGYEIGDIAYLIESNREIRQVTIKRRSGNFYIAQFNTGGGIQVRENRLFATYEEAQKQLPAGQTRRKTQYDYMH